MISSTLPALAQDASSGDTDLGGVTVTDTAIDEAPYKVDRADSPKYTAPLVDTPRSITVIGEQVLKDTASTTLTEALRTVPGITFGAGEGGTPLGDRPFIRGFDSQNSLYLDGVRNIGASTRETFDIESIEVVKGSDGVTGGSGNAGGSINLVSKKPTSTRFIRAEGTYGSADYKRATIDINQPLNDFIGVRLNAMYHDQNIAGRDAIFQKRWGIAPSVTIGLTGPTSLTVDYYHLHTNELPDSGIPYVTVLGNQANGYVLTPPATHYTTIAGQTIDVPRGAFYGLVDRDFRKTDVDEFAIRARHEFANGFVLRNTSLYSRSRQAYIWTQPDDSQGNVTGTSTASPRTSGNYVWRRANSRYGTYESLTNQTDLSGKFDTGGIRHSIAASLEYNYQSSSYGGFVTDAAFGTALSTGSTFTPRCAAQTVNRVVYDPVARYNCTSASAPNPYDPWVNYASDTSTVPASIVRSALKTQTLTHSSQYSAGLYDTVTITDWLLLNLGGRYDRVSTTLSPGLAATATTARTYFNKKNDLWTYQAGVVVKPVSNVSLYVSTGKSAIAPSSFVGQGSEDNAINQTMLITADDLKVQRTMSYEAGVKAELFDRALLLTADVFQTRTKNARTTNPDGTLSYVGTRRIRGFEISYSGNITPAWNVFGGFTYTPSKVLYAGLTTTTLGGVSIIAPAVATGKPFPNTPKTSFTAFTNYKVTPKLTIGGGAIHQGLVYGGFMDNRTIQNGVLVITKQRATYAPAYWRFDANASYQLTDNIGLRVNALNLTNKRYFDQAFSTHYAHQAAGRTVLGTVSLRY